MKPEITNKKVVGKIPKYSEVKQTQNKGQRNFRRNFKIF